MTDLIIIAGPTAAGKTSLSLKLAADINGSIISADSMQVYKGMDIGTAKISGEEMGNIPHYLIDVLDPHEDFNVVRFQQMAKDAISQVTEAKRIPIITGGTGFYIHSLLYDTDFTDTDENSGYRDTVTALIRERGAGYVHKMLEEVDPEAAARIHENDHKRMIRALEFYAQTGRPISENNEQNAQKDSPYNFCYFVLTDKREEIYRRIDRRVDIMMENGLADEVKRLTDSGLGRDNISMQGLGYKEIIDHLEGNCTLEEAVYRIKRDSRHFAKRQLTWFAREKDVIYLDRSKGYDIYEKMMEEIKRKGIINDC